MSVSINTQLQQAILHQAIIRVRPDYFSWPQEQQERYRADVPEQDLDRIKQSLLKNLFGIEVHSAEEQEDVFDQFTDEQFFLFNSTMLPFTGIGENSFFLNEYLDDKTLLDFDTLYDYDYDDFQFQEKCRMEDSPGYQKQPYYGSLYYTWARLMVDGSFYYATLSCLAAYVVNQAEDSAFDKINELIPHEYVDGKDHGKPQGKGFIYDKRIDAGGLEGPLEELRDRYYQYANGRNRQLKEEYNQKQLKKVFVLDNNKGYDPQLDFIFTDKTALRAVRFKTFMRDCKAIQGNTEDLNALIVAEKKNTLEFVENNYKDIMATYDPKVVKLRKKRQIIISDQAARDLL